MCKKIRYKLIERQRCVEHEKTKHGNCRSVNVLSLPQQAKHIFLFRPLFFELSTSQNVSSSGSATRNASGDTFPWLQVLCFVHTQRAVNTIRRKNVSEKMKIQADFELYTLFTKLQRPLNDEIF